jgi:hypothetical protein
MKNYFMQMAIGSMSQYARTTLINNLRTIHGDYFATADEAKTMIDCVEQACCVLADGGRQEVADFVYAYYLNDYSPSNRIAKALSDYARNCNRPVFCMPFNNDEHAFGIIFYLNGELDHIITCSTANAMYDAGKRQIRQYERRHCDCESELCQVQHQIGRCDNQGIVKTTWNTICDACSEFLPTEYK